MAYKKFSDFVIFDPPDVNDYLVGYRELGGEFRTTVGDVAQLVQQFTVPTIPNSIYVNISGNDASFGTSDAFAFRTIKRAMAKALEISRAINSTQWLIEQENGWGTASNPVVVMVKGGDYVEDNPIYVPPGVSLIGEGLKSVTIIPKNKFYDILWVNNQTYIENISFKDYYSPAYTVAFPEFGYLNGSYVQNFPSTRIIGATGLAFFFYNTNPILYPSTKENKADLDNFAIDNGAPIYDPFRIAFLNRYFKNIPNNTVFYTEGESFQDIDFWETNYYSLTSTIQKPYIILPPYINACSSKTKPTGYFSGDNDGGGSVYIDGYKANGLVPSIIINDFEQFNEGGRGIYVTNNAVGNVMGTRSTCCNEAVYTDNGGFCFVNNSNIFYGASGLVAVGKSPKPTLIGTLKQNVTGFFNKLTVTNLGSPTVTGRQEFFYNTTPFAGQIFSIVDRNYIVVSTGLNYLTATNSGSYFSVQSASPLRPATAPYSGYECDIILENYYNLNEDISLQASTYEPPVTGFNAGSNLPAGAIENQGVDVLFYNRSSIFTSSQIFNNVGSGTIYLSAPSQYGGISDENKELVEYDGGKIYGNSINEKGNFKIGNLFKYDQDKSQLTLNSINSYDVVTTNLTALSSNIQSIEAINLNLINLTVSNLISALSANFYNTYINALTTNTGYSNSYTINTLLVASFSALSANFQSTQVQSATGLDITGNVSISGNLNVGGTINGSEFLYNSLESPTLTGLKQALDELLYTPVSISTFTIQGNNVLTVEIGTSFITPLNIVWNTSKPSPQAITQYNLRLPNSQVLTNNFTFLNYSDINTYGTYFNTLPGSNTQVLTTWSLTATDWKGNRATSTASIAWQSKIYWGVTSNLNPSDFEIRNNAIHQQLATNRFEGGVKTLSPSNQYYYIAYPQRFGALAGTPRIRVNGANDDTDISRVDIVTFVNGSGGTDSYYVYRGNNLLTGTYTVQIVS